MKNLYSIYSESKLIALLKNGDRDALGELYNRYSVRLYNYSLKAVKDESTAQDIVHDTFLRLWENRASIKSDTTVSPLLFTISKNLVINGIKKMVHSRIYEDFVTYKNGPERFRNAEAEDNLDFMFFRKRLNSIVRDMPQTQKDVFILSRIKGMKNQEIANELNIKEQTVKNKISMALKVIREKLDKC